MLQDIMVSLGGPVAEEIIFKDITTGASKSRKIKKQGESIMKKVKIRLIILVQTIDKFNTRNNLRNNLILFTYFYLLPNIWLA